MPCYPFLAILLAYYLHKTVASQFALPRWPLWVYLVLTLAIPPGVYLALEQEAYLAHLSGLSWYFILLPVGALAGLWYAYRGAIARSFYALSLSFVTLNVLFFLLIFPKVDRENPVFMARDLLNREDMAIAYYKRINPSFVFYLQKPVQPLHSPEELKAYLGSNKNAYVISRARYWHEIYPSGNFEILVQSRDLFEKPSTILVREIE